MTTDERMTQVTNKLIELGIDIEDMGHVEYEETVIRGVELTERVKGNLEISIDDITHEEMLDLYIHLGITDKEIGKRLGVCERDIESKREEMGIDIVDGYIYQAERFVRDRY